MKQEIKTTEYFCDACKSKIDAPANLVKFNNDTVKYQGDAWLVEVSVKIDIVIPYVGNQDLCKECAKDILEQAIRSLSKQTKDK